MATRSKQTRNRIEERIVVETVAAVVREKREWDGVNISRDSNVVHDRLNGSCGPTTSLGKGENSRGARIHTASV